MKPRNHDTRIIPRTPEAACRRLNYSLLSDFLVSLKSELKKEQNKPDTGNMKQLFAMLDHAIEQSPEPPEYLKDTLVHAGEVFTRVNTYDRAEYCYDRVLDIDPNCDKAYQAKAIACMNTGELETAIEYLKKTIDINPLNRTAYYYIGLCQKIQGYYSDAEESFNRFCAFANTSDKDDAFMLQHSKNCYATCIKKSPVRHCS